MGFIQSFTDVLKAGPQFAFEAVTRPFKGLFPSPDTPNLQPQELDSENIATIEMGKTPDIMWGTRLLNKPNVINYGKVRSTPIYSSGGGKK